MSVSAAYQIHRDDGEELYEHVALHEHGDGECDVIANCGVRHTDSIPFDECVVASRWVLVRAGMAQC